MAQQGFAGGLGSALSILDSAENTMHAESLLSP